jgi:hypothetical protein
MERRPGFRREERDALTARGAMSGTASASISAHPTAPSGGPPTAHRTETRRCRTPFGIRTGGPGARVTASTPERPAHSARPRGPDSHLTWQRPASGLRSALYLGISSTRPRLLSVSDNFRARGSGRSCGAHELPRRKRLARSQPARYPTWTPLIQHKTSGQRPWRGYRRQPVPSCQAGHRLVAASGNSPRVPRR